MEYILSIIDEIDLVINSSKYMRDQDVLMRSKIERLVRKGETTLQEMKRRNRIMSPLYKKSCCDLYNILKALKKKLVQKLVNMKSKYNN